MRNCVPFADLVGLPYKEGGRGPKEWDCFGILREMSARFGYDIPDYPTRHRAVENAETVLKAMDAGWTELADPDVGCAVLMRVDGHLSHVGIVVEPGKMMHVIEGQAVVVQSLNHPQWEDRIVGFYRWTGLRNSESRDIGG